MFTTGKVIIKSWNLPSAFNAQE